MRGNQPVIGLFDAPNGKRISQLMLGKAFVVEKAEGPIVLAAWPVVI